jgi:hypothetical protein
VFFCGLIGVTIAAGMFLGAGAGAPMAMGLLAWLVGLAHVAFLFP